VRLEPAREVGVLEEALEGGLEPAHIVRTETFPPLFIEFCVEPPARVLEFPTLEPLAAGALAQGATSGNTLTVEELSDDCDGDAILLRVRPTCPACHTGAESCFAPWLWRRIKERELQRPTGSYVGSLLDDPALAARKVGEEGLEAALAGAGESDERLVEEIADVVFHAYALLAARGVALEAVEAELQRRAAG
jgi:phosphoribosyl-AMP cyclohydrolase / phosphoribosyl-ATP pyrophosphohydrolase